jgi:subtilase family serine protease
VVPAGPADFYNLVVVADSSAVNTERDESNNLLVSAATLDLIDPPELVPVAVASTLPAVPAASNLDLTFSIDNIRSPAAGTFAVSFVLSANGVVGDGDDIALPLVSGGTVAGIAGNDSVTNQMATVTIPNTVVAGSYFLGMIVDSGNTVVEQNEDNNTLVSAALLTVQPIVDLVVTDVSGAPLGAVVGGSFNVSNTVQANLNDAQTAFNVGIYLSTDSVINTGDTQIGTRQVLSLANGAISESTNTLATIPTMTPGLYYLGAYVDVGDSVLEGNEANNNLTAVKQISIGLATGGDPDLVISGLSGPASVARNAAFTVTPTVENIMPAAITPSFNVGIYLSSDSVITTDDYRLGGGSIVGLPGNSVDSSPVTVTIPLENDQAVNWSSLSGSASFNSDTNTLTGVNASWATSTQVIAGDGWVEWTVDAANVAYTLGFSDAVSDPSTSTVDNGFILRVDGKMKLYHNGSVYPSGSFTLGSYSSGDVFRVERVGTNVYFRRTTAAGGSSTIYMSVNSSVGDVVPDAEFGGAATVVNARVIDVPVAPGNYYLGAIVDDSYAVVEVSEANNSSTQTDGTAVATVVSVRSSSSSAAQGGGASSGFELALLLLAWLIIVNRGGEPGNGIRRGRWHRHHG